MAPAIISDGSRVFEIVSQGNVVLNCSTKYAVGYATVAVRFWEPPVPPSYVNPSANISQNCGVDSSYGCTGALMQVNMAIDSLGPFTSTFPGGYGMGLFSYNAGAVSIKALSRATGYTQSIFSGTPPSLSTVNSYPAVIAQLCATCGAADV